MFLEFPVVSNIISKLRSFLGVKFLPKEVSTLIHSLLDFNDTFLRKAFEVDGLDAGPHEKGEVLAEVYPGLPQHSANEVFFLPTKKEILGNSEYATKIIRKQVVLLGGLGISHVCMA